MRSPVLLIDDSQDIHDLVEVRLRSENIEMRHALDVQSAWRELKSHPPDLILLDLDLSTQSGLELCRQLKEEPELRAIPIVFLTGTADPQVKAQALDAGAVDYVTKPFDATELRARVRAALRTKRLHDLLATRAQLDGLTGLWNRAYLDDRLGTELSAAVRHERPMSLILLDIDHFKGLNDTYGHPFGDEVLRQVAEAMTEALRKSDVACRYGGEEFAVILRETGAPAALSVAERLRCSLEKLAFDDSRGPVGITASFGVVSRDAKASPSLGFDSPEGLVHAADRALYAAKAAGRNRVMSGVPETAKG